MENFPNKYTAYIQLASAQVTLRINSLIPVIEDAVLVCPDTYHIFWATKMYARLFSEAYFTVFRMCTDFIKSGQNVVCKQCVIWKPTVYIEQLWFKRIFPNVQKSWKQHTLLEENKGLSSFYLFFLHTVPLPLNGNEPLCAPPTSSFMSGLGNWQQTEQEDVLDNT